MKTGVLLINLGTPDAPRSTEVRRYLREFLSDPRVIDISAPARFVLVQGIIAPFRAPKAAEAYSQVWTDRGSPLLFNSVDLRDGLREKLAEVPVELGMRYGSPSLTSAFDALIAQGCSRILCVPLYPQYASSSTGSSLERVYQLAAERNNTPYLEAVPPFFDDSRFLAAQADLIRPLLTGAEGEHLLFSYHGLPERHCAVGEQASHCLKSSDCCDTLQAINRDCYRAHCFATTRGLCAELGIEEGKTTSSFQSRLGRTPWIQPYTDILIPDMPARGIQRLIVVCPSFVSDCLETLEEIGIRAKSDFLDAGGKEFELVPCLNADPNWINALGAMIQDRL